MTKGAVVLAAVVAVAWPSTARADRRIFTYSYPYMTLPQGTLELEHYLDLGLNNWDNPATPALERDWSRPYWGHMIELEYGITDRLDFGFYNVFHQDPFGVLKFDGVKLRSRYRFADPGVHPVDTSVYAEVTYFGDEVELEQKLILSKIVGRVEIVGNATVEEGYEIQSGEWEYLLTPSVGLGYHVVPALAFGLEYLGRGKIEEGELAYFAHYVGPVMSVASGPFYWTVGAQWQLGKRSDMPSIQLRSLLGIVL
jgi:hypothetical protein